MRDMIADQALRAPPSNPEAEQALLGALLVDNRAVEEVSTLVRPEDFAHEVHGRIFAAILSLVGNGVVVNPITLKNRFDQDGALADVGGARYLVRLAASVVTILNAGDYARQISDLARRREFIAACLDGIENAHAFGTDANVDDVIAAHVTTVSEIEARGEIGDAPSLAMLLRPVTAQIEATWRGEVPAGIATGFLDLDRILGALRPGQLIVIAARPSMGKTALALTCGRHVTHAGGRVGFFSHEMSAEEIGERLISGESGVSAHALRRRVASFEDLCRFVETATNLELLLLSIDDRVGNVAEIERRARRMKRAGGLALVIVDYLQLVRATGRDRATRAEDVGEIARDLKAMAKRLGVPVIALSQLSRAVEARDDKRPTLSDLRESGEIEQAADAVMFVYREEYYLERAEPQRRANDGDAQFNDRREAWERQLDGARGVAELIVAKNRNGPLGKVELRFDPETMVFHNLADADRLPWRREA